MPIKEAERRAGWRSLPQKVRIAIRRLHRQFGHVPQKVLLNLLRSARVSKQYIDAVKYFRCVECEESAPRRTGHKTSLPNRYEFNYALGVDVLEILDADGTKAQIQSVLDESCLTKNSLLRNGGYSPSQWVLGKTAREAPSLVSEDQFADLGAIEDQVDPESRFALKASG